MLLDRTHVSRSFHACLRKTGDGPENRRAVHLSESRRRQQLGWSLMRSPCEVRALANVDFVFVAPLDPFVVSVALFHSCTPSIASCAMQRAGAMLSYSKADRKSTR